MSGLESISAAISITSAIGKVAFRAYMRGGEARKELKQLTQGLTQAQKSGLRHWLDYPATQHQVESEDAALHEAAELALAAAITDAGAQPPTHLGTYVSGARRVFLAWKAPHEMAAATQDVVRAEARSVRNWLHENQGDASREDLALPEDVSDLIRLIEPQADRRRLARYLAARPSRAGIEAAHLDRSDCAAAEAVALYAEYRSWYAEAADWYERATESAPQPERLYVRAAFNRQRIGESDAVQRLLGIASDSGCSAQMQEVVQALRDDVDYTPRCADIDWAERDIDLVAHLAISGHQANTKAEACRIADAWVEHHRSVRSLSLAASAYFSLAATDGPRSRMMVKALQLARDARASGHAANVPASAATQVAVEVLLDLNRVTEIPRLVTESAEAGWKREDFSDSETAGKVALANVILGNDPAASVELTPFLQRYFEIVNPGPRQADAIARVSLDDLESLLELASTETERSRVLLAMAHAGLLDDHHLEALEGSDQASIAVLQSAQLLATGDAARAASLVRPHAAQSPEATAQLCAILDHTHSDLELIDAALNGWDCHADVAMFVLAAGRVAELRPPPEDVVSRLNRATAQAMVSLEERQQQAVYENLVVANLNCGQAEVALMHAASLHAVVDIDHSRWRLALCYALTGTHERAWHLLLRQHERPLLEPREDLERRLLASLALQFSDHPRQVHALLAMSKADDPEVEGFCLAVCQMLASRMEDSELSTSVQTAIKDFTQANPSSEIIRAISLDDDDPVASLNELVQPRPVETAQFDRLLALGRLPYAFLTALSGKSVATLLVRRGLEWIFAAADGVAARSRERRHATEALGRGVVIDVTALHVLAELRRFESAELIGFFNVSLPTPVAQDAAYVRGDVPGHSIIIPNTGEPGIQAIVELSEDDRALQVQRQHGLADLAESLPKKALSGELAIAPYPHMNDFGRAAWAAGELGLRDGLPVWADDVALRQLLHRHGIATFGTRAVIDALQSRGHITDEEANQAIDALRDAHVTDLPVRLSTLIDLAQSVQATEEHAFALRLAGWWTAQGNIQLGRLAILFDALAMNHPEQLKLWFRSACIGATLANQEQAEAVPALLTVALLVHSAAIRENIDSLLDGAGQALWAVRAELAPENLVAAVAAWLDLDAESEEAVRLLLPLLPDTSRTYAELNASTDEGDDEDKGHSCDVDD